MSWLQPWLSDYGDELTSAELRVARWVAQDPGLVAFGTVATIAESAAVSNATVVRFARRIGYDGFSAFQENARLLVSQRLRPAAERIRAERATDVLGRTLDTEVANVVGTLERADRKAFAAATALLADPKRTVWVLAGEATAGIASTIASNLDLLRDAVHTITGTPLAVARTLERVERGDVLFVIEVRRYERWVIDAVDAVRERVALVTITDSVVAPVAESAKATFVVDAAGAGPFDSHVATLALGNALVAEVANRLRPTATPRLDAVEAATADLLVD